MQLLSSGTLKTIALAACFLISFSFAPVTAFQASEQADNDELETAGGQQRWAAFPILASSPETGFLFGGMLFHFFPVVDPDRQASTIDLMTFLTTEKQYLIMLSPNIFFENNRYRFNSSVFYSSWIANYYGIGNDSPDDPEEYEAESYGATITMEMKIRNCFILGILGAYSFENMSTEAGGMLQTGAVIGSADYEFLGLGFRAGYDTRDNTNSPRGGVLAAYEIRWAEKDFGSDHSFSIQSLDLRYYLPVSMDKVLAFSAQIHDGNGQVPFRLLPSPDGTMLLRGIENGRYRDEVLLGLQSEFRFPIRKKFSGTVFAEAAQVAHDFSAIELPSFKTSLGIGFRYALNPDQRFNLRADIAWVDNGFAAIINVREAF
jgi:outer membrane protein assembly factor BamA